MKRCDKCGGTFGLIAYRYYARRFCTNNCKALYLRELRQRAQDSARERTSWPPPATPNQVSAPLAWSVAGQIRAQRAHRATPALEWRHVAELRKGRNVKAAQRLRARMEEEEKRKPNVSYRAR
jgi:hypothetical protein